jgi:2-(1,2-epoxy-1,2-dihydrophenyl)acetyl-CoA isomerase
MGMIYKVYADAGFTEQSIKLATLLAAMPTKALYYIKQALNNSISQNLQQQLQTEDEYQQKAAATNDFKEGVKAFLALFL